jgi:leader peptidase (prepilin peptidase) / N-methyltransferase
MSATPPDAAPEASAVATMSIPPWLLAAVYAVVALPVLWAGPRTWAVLLPTLILGTVLVALSLIDLATMRLPDALTLPLIAAGLVCALVLKWDGGSWLDLRWRVTAAALGYGLLYGIAWLYHRLRGRHGLGLGDAKLLAASGAWLGIEGIAPTLLVASLTGLVAALIGHVAGRPVTADTRVPFGPFLAGATWLIWLYGPQSQGLA